MGTEAHHYRPDYAVAPGAIVLERLAARGISRAEFARRCDRSPKRLSEIIAGKAPVEPETALQFEKVLGVDASILLGIETDYQLHRAREAEAKKTQEASSWTQAFPLQELVRRGIMEKPSSDSNTVARLLTFFEVGSVKAWYAKYERMSVAYRHSPSFRSETPALATWLRLGELEAEQQECADYDAEQFRRVLRKIRGLTQTPVADAIEKAQHLCNKAGVVLAPLKPFPKTALSGAAWWLTPRKAVITLSARHKTDDHLWFSLFHEAAHLLLHSKKAVFLDEMQKNNTGADIETQADKWASDFLVPRSHWDQFVNAASYSERAIRQFAREQDIAPGIIVGRLQHEKHLSWGTPLNKLKVRLEWKTAS